MEKEITEDKMGETVKQIVETNGDSKVALGVMVDYVIQLSIRVKELESKMESFQHILGK